MTRPTLDELLSDPMIQLVMKSDGLRADDFRRSFAVVRAKAEMQGIVPPAHVIDGCRRLHLCA